MSTLGVIGGSGLYGVPEIVVEDEVQVETPYGRPSSPVVRGRIGDMKVLFLARHGRGHVFTPTEVPYQANVWALKKLGADAVLSISAVGSLREEIHPGHLALPDQIIDRTTLRPNTFLGSGVVGHVAMADPYCPSLRSAVLTAASRTSAQIHKAGCLVCIEGPQFSTKAESHMYRAWGADLIGMTVMPEARLVREAGMCYSTLALATDYDCWHPGHESVTVDQVIQVMHGNISKARNTLLELASVLPARIPCSCHSSLEVAVVTDPRLMSQEAKERLAFLRS